MQEQRRREAAWCVPKPQTAYVPLNESVKSADRDWRFPSSVGTVPESSLYSMVNRAPRLMRYPTWVGTSCSLVMRCHRPIHTHRRQMRCHPE